MAKLTDEKIAELKALCEKATPSEYKVATWRAGKSVSVAIVARVDEGDEYIVAEMLAEEDQAEIDARELVAARTALPDLISDLEEARRDAERYNDLYLDAHRDWKVAKTKTRDVELRLESAERALAAAPKEAEHEQ